MMERRKNIDNQTEIQKEKGRDRDRQTELERCITTEGKLWRDYGSLHMI